MGKHLPKTLISTRFTHEEKDVINYLGGRNTSDWVRSACYEKALRDSPALQVLFEKHKLNCHRDLALELAFVDYAEQLNTHQG